GPYLVTSRPLIGVMAMSGIVKVRKTSPVSKCFRSRTSCRYSVRKNRIDPNIQLPTNDTTAAPANGNERKRPNSTSGSRTRVSTTTKAISSTTPVTNEPMISGEPHPSVPLSWRARMNSTMPAVINAKPVQSMRPVNVSSLDSSTLISVRMITPMPTGMLMKKNRRHETVWVNNPATNGPTAEPMQPMPDQMPMADERSSA